LLFVHDGLGGHLVNLWLMTAILTIMLPTVFGLLIWLIGSTSRPQPDMKVSEATEEVQHTAEEHQEEEDANALFPIGFYNLLDCANPRSKNGYTQMSKAKAGSELFCDCSSPRTKEAYAQRTILEPPELSRAGG
jgi:hypothetical protein